MPWLSAHPEFGRLGEVLCLLGLIPGQHQRVNLTVALTGDSITTGGGSGLSRSFSRSAAALSSNDKGQHLVKAGQDGPLGGIVGLGLQHIVEQRDAWAVLRSLPSC